MGLVIGMYKSLNSQPITKTGYVVLNKSADKSLFIPVEKACSVTICYAMKELAASDPGIADYNYDITEQTVTLKPDDFVRNLRTYNKSVPGKLNKGTPVLEELKRINTQSIYPPSSIVLEYWPLNDDLRDALKETFLPYLSDIFRVNSNNH